MSISTNSQAASKHSRSISNAGALNNRTIRTVNGGNTRGVEQANVIGTRVSGIFSRYRSVATNSARSINILSNNMVSFDVIAGQQIRTGFTMK